MPFCWYTCMRPCAVAPKAKSSTSGTSAPDGMPMPIGLSPTSLSMPPQGAMVGSALVVAMPIMSASTAMRA